MSSNLENDRSMTTNKMYPIDLAPQKITIVKNVPNSEVKMAQLISGQPKPTGSQIITHTGSMGLIRPAGQIISSSVGSQVSCPFSIVSNPIYSSLLFISNKINSNMFEMVTATDDSKRQSNNSRDTNY